MFYTRIEIPADVIERRNLLDDIRSYLQMGPEYRCCAHATHPYNLMEYRLITYLFTKNGIEVI